MRIAFVTQWFPPEVGAKVSFAIARGLEARGHHVDVLTGFPNYPTGELHPDYPLRLYRRDHAEPGMDVHRAWLYPSHDRSSARRAANYLSFALGATIVARSRLPKPDAWLVYSSPATAALPALLARGGERAPVFLLIQDLWPDSVTGSSLLSGRAAELADQLLTPYCQWTYRRAAGIGVISPGMANVLTERGVAPEKIHYTPNWFGDEALVEAGRSPEELRADLGLPHDGRLFLYAGNLGEFQELGPLLRAFAACPEARLVLAGEGVEKQSLQALAGSLHLSNVHFVGYQTHERIGRYLAAADVQVVSLRDTPLMRVTTPSKLQTSLATGRPVLAHAAGDVAAAVTRSGGGVAASPGNVAETAAAIRRLASCSAEELERMGAAARRYYDEHFTEESGLDRLEAMLLGRSEALAQV